MKGKGEKGGRNKSIKVRGSGKNVKRKRGEKET